MGKIDLKRFAEEKEVLSPIVNHITRIEGRLVNLAIEDGWYWFKLGNDVQVSRKATPMDIEIALEKAKVAKGYPVGEDVVPMNFDNFFKKGYGESIKVHFLNEQPWEIVRFVEWEDGRCYSAGVDIKANRTVIKAVKEAFETEKPLDGISGVTPELRYYFLIHSLQRDAFRVAEEFAKMKLAEEERKKRIEEFQKTFAGRIQKTVEDAGGKLVRFYQRGRNYVVIWKVYNQQVTSTIRDDFGIMDLGFCASGQDRLHSLPSAIQLARQYYEDNETRHGGLYITRE